MVQFTCLPAVLAALTLYSGVAQAQNTTLTFDEIIGSDENLSSLSAALMAAGLNISDAFPDDVTLFAPNNAAFTTATPLLSKFAAEQYLGHLQNLLLMHVVPAAVLSTDLMDGQVVEATNKENVTVAIDNTTVTLSTADNTATVVAVDALSSDGVLHQIDTVLLPAFVNTSLIDLTESVSGFSIILDLMRITGLAALVGPNLTATVFAPTDEAFMALPEGAIEYFKSNEGVATKLLSGHVITPTIIPTVNMVNGPLDVKTPGGTTLTIEIVESERTKIIKVNNATIIRPDVLANNGVIHALSQVIAVPGTEFPPPSPTAPTTPTAPSPAAPTSSATATTVAVATAISSLFGWFLLA